MKTIYKVNTNEKLNQLLDELVAKGQFTNNEVDGMRSVWGVHNEDTCVRVEDHDIGYCNYDFYINNVEYRNYDFVDYVSNGTEHIAVKNIDNLGICVDCNDFDIAKVVCVKFIKNQI